MNHDPNNDPQLNDLLAQEADAFENVPPVLPSAESLELARQAVRVELEMGCLREAADDPLPSKLVMERLRQRVRTELTPAISTLVRPRRRSLPAWIRVGLPASVAAGLVFATGLLYWSPKSTQIESDAESIIASAMDYEFQSDWYQLANLEASFDEVERDLRGAAGSTSPRKRFRDVTEQIDDLSKDLAALEDMT